MEVDEAPRSKGRFNLDRAAQEHMNEGLEVWITTESTSSLRGLETQPIRPLMDVALPDYTPSSTPSGSQVSGSSSRLKESNERLQLRNRESPARVQLPPTLREQPVRSVVIASYKKNTEARYHRHIRMDWNTAKRARMDCFHDAAWVEYYTQPRVPEGTVHLIIGDSLLRVLTRIQSHWQTGILSFSGAAMPQILASLEMLGMARVYTVTLMIGTNDVSRGESRKVMRLHDKMCCILEELRIQMDPAILTVCIIPYNKKADQHAMEMNTKVRNLNEVVRQIHQRSVLPIGLLDVTEQMEQAAFPDDASSDGIHFDRPRGVEWLNDLFQKHISALEAELLETAQFTFGPNPLSLPQEPYQVAWGRGSILETAREVAGLDYRVLHRWRPRKQRPQRPRVLGGSGREQEGGETGGDKPDEISGEGKGAGPGGSGVQTRVGGSSGPRARVTRGLK